MFSVTFKALMMFVTFLQFQNTLYVVLASVKCLKISVHRDLFKTKNPQNPSCTLHAAWCMDRPSA